MSLAAERGLEECAPGAGETSAAGEAARWPLAKRIGFRFVFAWAAVHLLPFPLDIVPKLGDWIDHLWHWLPHRAVPWIGHRLLGITSEIGSTPNGSGDRTYHYVALLTAVALAAQVALIWSLLARKQTSHPRLAQLLRNYLRLNLAVAMLSYGLSKVFRTQFPELLLQEFMLPMSSMSPMGLLWRLMSFSPGYTMFTGAIEVLGGLLLIPRRTWSLGALVSAGAMANVVALNFFYDVPVKLYSTQLFLTALWVAGPDLSRLADLLIRSRPVQPAAPDWRPVSRRVRVTLRVLEIAFFVYFGYSTVTSRLETRKEYAAWHAGPLTGLYSLVPTLAEPSSPFAQATALSRWCKLVFDGGRMMSVTHDDQIHTFAVAADEKTRTVILTHDDRDSQPEQKLLLTWSDDGPAARVLSGSGVTLRMKRQDPSQTRLMGRGFHWINEFPYNR
jgi:hypothetical protein